MSQYSTQFKPTISPNLKKVEKNQDVTHVPPNLYVTIFSPHPLPDEVKESVPLVHSLPNESLESIASAIVMNICQLPAEKIPWEEDFITLQKSLKLLDMGGDFGIIYTSFYLILRVILRNRIPQSKARSGLLELNFPSIVVNQIIKATIDIRNDKFKLVKFQEQFICRWPTISKLKWRVDVIISSGSLSRVMRPHIFIRMILSDGKVKTFALSIDQFNQLRHATAKLLYDMQTLERHPIMRIVNEFKMKEIEDISK